MSSFLPVRTDPVALAQRPHPTASQILPEAVEFLFHCMGNRRDFFNECARSLRPHYFTAEESMLSAVLEVMLGLAGQFSGKFAYEALALSFRDYLQIRQINISPEKHQDLFAPNDTGLLWTMTNTPYGDEHLAYARQLLQRFLMERTVVLPLRGLMASTQNGNYPTNLRDLLGEYNYQAARLSSMSVLPVVDAAPVRGAAPIKVASEYKPTGVDFIDRAIGGQRIGDANGIIGVTGGGKTTLAVHMAVSAVRRAWGEAIEAVVRNPGTNIRPEIIVYITVEESGKKLFPRLWSAMYQIPRAKLDRIRDWNELTEPGRLDDYERRLPGNYGPSQEPPSETERYDASRHILAGGFELLDFSGSDEYPDAGCGGVPEIVSALVRLQQERQQPIRTVILDYAGLTVERSAGTTLDDRKLRLGLKRIGGDMRKMVAERFRCTVWLLHQLAGAVGQCSPLRLMHHTHAGESKDFANNLAFCGCLGVPDSHTGIRRLNWSKTRSNGNESVAPVSLQIDETFAVMRDVTSDYAIDDVARRFVRRDEIFQIHGLSSGVRRDLLQPSAASSPHRVSADGLV
jgi:hypothetical protein